MDSFFINRIYLLKELINRWAAPGELPRSTTSYIWIITIWYKPSISNANRKPLYYWKWERFSLSLVWWRFSKTKVVTNILSEMYELSRSSWWRGGESNPQDNSDNLCLIPDPPHWFSLHNRCSRTDQDNPSFLRILWITTRLNSG